VIVPEHVYRTEDGRLVRHGDPAAAFLAFARGDEVGDLEAGKNGLSDLFASEKPTEKAQAKPADKAAPKAANK